MIIWPMKMFQLRFWTDRWGDWETKKLHWSKSFEGINKLRVLHWSRGVHNEMISLYLSFYSSLRFILFWPKDLNSCNLSFSCHIAYIILMRLCFNDNWWISWKISCNLSCILPSCWIVGTYLTILKLVFISFDGEYSQGLDVVIPHKLEGWDMKKCFKKYDLRFVIYEHYRWLVVWITLIGGLHG